MRGYAGPSGALPEAWPASPEASWEDAEPPGVVRDPRPAGPGFLVGIMGPSASYAEPGRSAVVCDDNRPGVSEARLYVLVALSVVESFVGKLQRRRRQK